MSYPKDFSKRESMDKTLRSYHGNRIAYDRNYQFFLNDLVKETNELERMIEEYKYKYDRGIFK